MQLFQIKHRFTNEVVFELETQSLKLCVEAAVKAGADLAGAYLARADLAGAVGIADAITIGPIGSRRDVLTATTDGASITVTTGCFRGSLDEFRCAVDNEHGDNQHGRHYRLAIELIRARLITETEVAQ